MGMPTDLVLVRHGQSEGNVAQRAAKRGDESLFTPEFRNRDASSWRLTEEGREQANLAGTWLRGEFPDGFDRYYTSSHLRARETAALLDLPDAQWRIEQYLQERSRGLMDAIPPSEREARWPGLTAAQGRDPFHWQPPSGESISAVDLRLRAMLDTFHRECDGARIVVVCHGEVMWTLRYRLERLTPEEWNRRDGDPAYRIYNSEILHYTRRNPETGELARRLTHVRRIRPTEPEQVGPWQGFELMTYSNDDLLASVENADTRIPI